MFPTFFCRSLFAVVVGVSAMSGPATYAGQDIPMLLAPAPGVSARIDKRGADYILIQPSGQRVKLVVDDELFDGATPRFAQEDYDYDGYPDISIGLPAGMVNISQKIYLYDAGSTAYVPLDLPQATLQRQNCEGLWDMALIPDRKAIRSSCRGGARWHYDILQIEPDRSVWISEQSRTPEDDPGWSYFNKPVRSVSYDRQGNALSESVLPPEEGGQEKAAWIVPTKRLPLYSAPDRNAVTKGYLIKGDTTSMLAFEGEQWMKIAYDGKKGRIERWVSMKDAYGAAKP